MRHIRATIRFTLFTIATLGLYIFWRLSSLIVPNKIYWRQIAFGAWAKMFVMVAGAKIEVIGTPPKPPFLLVSNHLSAADVAVLRSVVPTIFVAKGEINGWTLAGAMVRNMGNVFINRQNRRDIPRAGNVILEHLDKGEGVVVFPEGTSTKGEEILPFNSAFLEFAAASATPVHYAVLNYRTPDGEPNASDAVCWWEDISFAVHLYRMFRVKHFTATVTFGEKPIVNTDRKSLAKELHEQAQERFIPII